MNPLETRYPIIQGALAQISRAPLVAAVSQAGGLGVLTTTELGLDELAQEIATIRSQTDAPFAVNLMLQQDNIEALVPYLIDHPVPVVTVSAGTPKRFAHALKEAGTKLVAVIPSVRIAEKMAALGVDLLVAEGMESGGHIGTETTFSLVQQVAENVSVPVFAAGGIADPVGVRAARALGASGVQSGTAFLVANETPIADAYKQAVIDADDTATVVTGRTLHDAVRSLKNSLTMRYLELEEQGASAEILRNLTDGSLKRAIDGDVDNGTLMAGQIAGKITARASAADIVQRLAEGFD